MKFVVYLLSFSLFGCGSFVTDRLFNDNMLDTAPKNNSDVIYPDWGRGAQVSGSGVRGPQGQKRPDSTYQSLQSFLLSNGIDYEVLPGQYMIVRVKRTVQFNVGSTNVAPESLVWLMKIRDYLAVTHGVELVIDGHTDDLGDSRYNDQLSKKRAEAVKRILASNRVSLDSIYTRGYGDVVPACTNQTQQGKACNRRVELFFILPS
ncbi:OmpA family protein [Vibrio mangrovi]|uniref:OmpA family protein n=1 Tax=Vibrio mangrovi TaxID=474394 RepID=A0A1Y6IWK0_9VIBR|nr:OmpA family protein [Vibrio mangrovi]MDW6005524.1 OmpA family protein [Vibrio mangrovi]SMS02034.1 Outer membrane porin F precursor [Vibrio mangrovi]